MTSIIQSIVNKSNPISYIPNRLIPFVCVFIITKTPAILLVGLVFGYIMVHQAKNGNNNKKMLLGPDIRMLGAPIIEEDHYQPAVNSYDVNTLDEEDNEDDNMTITSDGDENETMLLLENAQQQHILRKSSALLLDENILSNSFIDFENLMKFPSCPTTLPRLDTHFNFVIDHDIKSPNPSNIDWTAIHQELEYDQQRLQEVADYCSSINDDTKEQHHPLFLLHQLQQNDLSMMFSDKEGEALLSSLGLVNNSKSNNLMIINTKRVVMGDTHCNSVSTPTPFHDTTDAAILVVDDEEFENTTIKKKEEKNGTPLDVNIEDLLLLPSPPIPSKPSLSSPGQLFKSKFQKAVKKIKKSSNNFVKYEEAADKRSSTYINGNSKRAASLQLHSYFPQHQQQDPMFNSAALSPRPSTSARVHDHFKGRLNKLFKK